jgi:hypothetical protein
MIRLGFVYRNIGACLASVIVCGWLGLFDTDSVVHAGFLLVFCGWLMWLDREPVSA